ncbi:MAG: septum formation initiator family protein [bacterium]
MAQFKDKNQINQNKLWHSPISLLIIFCILVIFAYNMIGLIQKEVETRKKKIVQLENIETLRTRQEELDANIAKLSTDEGIEETIRDKYQVAKAGESVVNIVDESPRQAQSPQAVPKPSFWGFIKSLFKRN